MTESRVFEQRLERLAADPAVIGQGAGDGDEIIALDQQALRSAEDVGRVQQMPARQGRLARRGEAVQRELAPRRRERGVREIAVARVHEEQAGHGAPLPGFP